jgi:hypothetical protein
MSVLYCVNLEQLHLKDMFAFIIIIIIIIIILFCTGSERIVCDLSECLQQRNRAFILNVG